MRRTFLFCAALCVILGCATFAMAQSAWQPGHAGIGFDQPVGKQWVQMTSLPDMVVETAGKSRQQDVTLRFAIQSGLHINSHTPRSRFLIPTTLTLDQSAGVEISKIEYPPGVDYHFEFSPKDAVSVYTGEFPVHLHLRAVRGHHTLHGQLRYQACDNRTCTPPKSLPLTLEVTAR